MRDRLIELIKETRCEKDCDGFTKPETCKVCTANERYAESADYLLANGVIVPPCKMGDVVYHIDVSIEPNDRGKWTTRKRIKAEKFYYGMLDWIDTPLFLTREEAEQLLKGGAEE